MLDRLGISCAVLCIIHCLLPAILVAFSPSYAQILGNEIIHFAVLAIVVPVIFFSFFKGSKGAGSFTKTQWLALVGLTALLIPVVVEIILHAHIEWFETTFTIVGSILLIVAHLMNMKVILGSAQAS